MSHITTFNSKVVVKNDAWMRTALTSMQKEFAGLTYQQMDADTIMIRYKPIECYQRNGNMRMIKNHEKGIWEMQYDFYMCEQEANRVRDAFFQSYQTAGVTAWSKAKGYATTTTQKGKTTMITATKWG